MACLKTFHSRKSNISVDKKSSVCDTVSTMRNVVDKTEYATMTTAGQLVDKITEWHKADVDAMSYRWAYRNAVRLWQEVKELVMDAPSEQIELARRMGGMYAEELYNAIAQIG